jgi:hypothetical protein
MSACSLVVQKNPHQALPLPQMIATVIQILIARAMTKEEKKEEECKLKTTRKKQQAREMMVGEEVK